MRRVDEHIRVGGPVSLFAPRDSLVFGLPLLSTMAPAIGLGRLPNTGKSTTSSLSQSSSAAFTRGPPPQLQDCAIMMHPHQQQQHPHPQVLPHHLPSSHHPLLQQQQPQQRTPVQQQQQQPQQQQPHQQPQQTPQSQTNLTYQHNGDFVGTNNGRTYRLVVEQQPVRARMCGFGDKVRQPDASSLQTHLRHVTVNRIDGLSHLHLVSAWSCATPKPDWKLIPPMSIVLFSFSWLICGMRMGPAQST
jgi:hypothetical protein